MVIIEIIKYDDIAMKYDYRGVLIYLLIVHTLIIIAIRNYTNKNSMVMVILEYIYAYIHACSG